MLQVKAANQQVCQAWCSCHQGQHAWAVQGLGRQVQGAEPRAEAASPGGAGSHERRRLKVEVFVPQLLKLPQACSALHHLL